MIRKCTVPGCDRLLKAAGLCNAHYHRKVQAAKKKPCACGCGELTSYTYKHGHHTRLFTSQEQSRRGRQNDGSTQRDKGTADWYRKVRGRHEHRRVMEQILGRLLSCHEVVHHIDGNKKNNKPENLLLVSRAEHMQIHQAEIKAGRAARKRS